MADFQQALEARKKKAEADQVFEGYGRKKFSFKEGKRRPISDPTKLIKAMQVKGVESPTERTPALTFSDSGLGIGVEGFADVALRSRTEIVPLDEPGEAHLEDTQGQQPQDSTNQQQKGQRQEAPSSQCSPSKQIHNATGSTPSKKTLELSHRHNWATQTPVHLRFAKDQSSSEVQSKAHALASEFELPRQIAIRVALLYQFTEDGIGERIANIYLDAIKRLKAGITCSKLCQSSLKVKRKLLQFQIPEAALVIKGLGFAGYFSGSRQIDTRIIKDLFLGSRHSEEFREVNSRIKPLGQALQESRCCVLSTALRTYSLLMDRPSDLAAVCAVVDVATGRHGPAVWNPDGASNAVFATGFQARKVM
ncbi:uncharacterized protein LOC34619501 [Cyclospora cayetanensis]|uniref:Uncharacterized protein LOC34619501 n=1 Tax=Cyclospora cayetanensis TaxID=88456 RepID=A0A6P6S3T0_9EIME|nr:uncharacterized protein LOC34619501 [Cyclospora cayetanensis]